MIKNLFFVLMASFLVYISYNFYELNGHHRGQALHSYYANNAIQDLGSQNIVSSIVVSYRGLDTLGEVTILFLSALLVAFMIGLKKEKVKNILTLKESSEILETATSFLTPFITMLALYIVVNGHLSPGGGFQGGAIFATGLIFLMITNINYKIRTIIFKYIESLSGIFYVILGLFGMSLAIGFLNPKILPMGTLGQIMSAGLIPVIYSLVGLKVGTELSLIFYNFKNENK